MITVNIALLSSPQEHTQKDAYFHYCPIHTLHHIHSWKHSCSYAYIQQFYGLSQLFLMGIPLWVVHLHFELCNYRNCVQLSLRNSKV